MLPSALTLTATKRLLGTATGAGPKGGFTRYCGHRPQRPGRRRATDRFPITWTGDTDPQQPFSDLAGLHRTGRSKRACSTGWSPFPTSSSCCYGAYPFPNNPWSDTAVSSAARKDGRALFQHLADRRDVVRGVVADIQGRAAPSLVPVVIEPTAEQRLGGLVISASATRSTRLRDQVQVFASARSQDV